MQPPSTQTPPPATTIAMEPALKLAIGKILAAAELLEAGAAETPLCDGCRNLSDSATTGALKLVLIAWCPTARAAALRLLLPPGTPQPAFDAAFARWSDMVEIHFLQSGFSCADGARSLRFDAPEAFASHLQTMQSPPGIPADQAPLQIGLPQIAGQPDFVLLVAPSLDHLAGQPDLADLLSQNGDLLLLACHPDQPPPAGTTALLDQLSAAIPVTQPLLICPTEQAPRSQPNWLTTLGSSALAPPAYLVCRADATVDVSASQGVLRGRLPLLRPFLAHHRIARSTTSLVTTLRDRARAESETLTSARHNLLEAPAGPVADPGCRGVMEQLNSSLQSDIASLTRHAEDAIRDSLLPGGALFQLNREISEGLVSAQLSHTLQHKTHRYEAGEALLRRLRDRLLDQLVNEITRQGDFLKDALSATAETLTARLQEVAGTSVTLTLPPLRTNRLYDYAATLSSAPLLLRAEVPRTAGLQFAWTCFQNPIMILMSLMMPMGLFMSSLELAPILRKFKFDVALYCLIPMYLLTPFFLRARLRKEEAVGLEREMERLRNTLQADFERLARSVADERRKIFGEWLKAAGDDLRKQIATLLGEAARIDEKRRLDAKQNQQTRLQQLDARLRDVTLTYQQCDPLEREARLALESTTMKLHAVLRQSPTA
jgi:hypothetical protein